MELRSLIVTLVLVISMQGLVSKTKAQGIVPSFGSGSFWHVDPVKYNEFSDRRKKRKASTSLNGVVAPLAAKAQQIQRACGSKIISTVRHTNIAGTRRLSLHASGKAVDMAGNPRCIYAQLRGWPGGYTIDYSRVRHVHISYDRNGRREWGQRFAHGGGKRRGRTSVASIEHATEREVYTP